MKITIDVPPEQSVLSGGQVQETKVKTKYDAEDGSIEDVTKEIETLERGGFDVEVSIKAKEPKE